jgi:hypothetical protein
MRIIVVWVNIQNFNILRDKYPIFKFKRINIQIEMCRGVYTAILINAVIDTKLIIHIL